MTAQNVGIYVANPFDTMFGARKRDKLQQRQIADVGRLLGESGFDTVVLFSLHIHPEGDIYFNDAKMAAKGKVCDDFDPFLANVLEKMKTEGSVKNILVSFGGGGTFHGQAVGYWDFLNLKNLIAQHPDPADNPFFRNLSAILQAYPIDGVDIDLEVYAPDSYDPFMDTLTTLTSWVNGQKGLVTIAPYESFDFWADLLVNTYVGGQQQVAWVNLQGGNLSPADNGGFVRALQNKTIGVSNLAGFVSSGMQITTSGNGGQVVTADEVQQAYAPFGKKNPQAGGGWLFNFSWSSAKKEQSYSSFLPDQLQAFATAVREGLQGIEPSLQTKAVEPAGVEATA